MASIVSLPERTFGQAGWTNQELAELYRASDNLTRAGLPVGSEAGVTDEGHPWYIFYREDVQEVIVHFARIDGVFIAASAATDDVVQGQSFRSVIQQLLQRQPFVLPMPARSGGDLFLHPSVVLTAFIATAYMVSTGEAGQPADGAAAADDVAAAQGAETGSAPSLRQDVAARLEALVEKITGPARAPGAQQETASSSPATSSPVELSAIQTAAMASVLAVATAALQRDSVQSQDAAEEALARSEAGQSESEPGGGGSSQPSSGGQTAGGSQTGDPVVVSQEVAAQVNGHDETVTAAATQSDTAGTAEPGAEAELADVALQAQGSAELLSALYGADLAEALIEFQTAADGGPSDDMSADHMSADPASDPEAEAQADQSAPQAGEGAADTGENEVEASGDGAIASLDGGGEPDAYGDSGSDMAAGDGVFLEYFVALDGLSVGDGELSNVLEAAVSLTTSPADVLDGQTESALEVAALDDAGGFVDSPMIEAAGVIESGGEISVLNLGSAREQVVYTGGHLEVVGFQRGQDSLLIRDVDLTGDSLTYEVTESGDVTFTFAPGDTLTLVGLLTDFVGDALA